MEFRHSVPNARRGPSSQRIERNTDEGDVSLRQTELPNILYIMGTGRSGSTILEILLGCNPGIQQAGEITHIFKDGVVRGRNCACGASARECPVWGPVLKQVEERLGRAEDLQQLHEAIDSHRGFPKTLAGWHAAATMTRYVCCSELLFTGLSYSASVHTVIDSSKYAGRALSLARAFPEKVRIVFLTRSPSGLLRAFAKKHASEQLPKSRLETALYFCWVLLCARCVAGRVRERFMHIEYDSLSADPIEQIKRLEAWSGLDLGETRRRLAEDCEFEVGHLVTGNRIRYSTRVRFEASKGERGEMRKGSRMLAALMKLWQRAMVWDLSR